MKARIKSLLKSVASPCWRLCGPVRRPLMRKVDERISRLVSQALEAHRPSLHVTVEPPDLSTFEAAVREMAESLRVAREVSEHHAAEANLLMDSLVREIARLQMRLEDLADLVESSQSAAGLAVVGPDEGRSTLKAG